MKHEVELTISTVHDYSPIAVTAPGPFGPHQHGVVPMPSETRQVCIHMEKIEKSRIEPSIAPEMKMMMESLKQVMPQLDKLAQVSATAQIILTPEEYDNMGRPRPGETIHVSFEYERV